MIIDYSKIKNIFNFENIIMFIFLSISGNPFYNNNVLNVLFFIFLLYLFLKRKLSFNISFIVFYTIFFSIFLFQTIKFEYFSLITFFGISIKIFIAYLTVKILDKKFIDTLINVMFILTILSFLFFLISNISISLLKSLSISTSDDGLFTRYSVLGFFTFIDFAITRNSGMFWEPGAFGGYLLLVLIFNLIKKKKIFTKYNITFMVAIITTQSTTAIIGLFILLFVFFILLSNNHIIKFIVPLLILIISFQSYSSLDFLKNKINSQFTTAQNIKFVGESDNSQRFINILKDLNDFKNHELIGRGWNNSTRYELKADKYIRTVGFTDIIVKQGILFFIIMVLYIYLSLNNYIKHNYSQEKKLLTASLVFILMIPLMSEVYFNYPFYWSLLFLFTIYPKENNDLHSNPRI